MLRTAAIVISVVGFALPAIAQEKQPQLPENTIDCRQFKKTGSEAWTEAGTAVFDLGKIKNIHLTDQPVTPRFFKFDGVDLYPVVEQKCGAVAYFNRGNAAQAKGDYDNAVAEYNEALRLDPKLVSAKIQRVFALEGLTRRPPSNATAQAPITLEQGAAVPKTELAQDKNTSASAPAPTQANINALVQTPENETVKSQLESKSCGDRLAVYVADGLAGYESTRDLIEIAFNNKIDYAENSGERSEFSIRKYKNNNLEWAYKGGHGKGRFIFTPDKLKQENTFMRRIFTNVHSSGKKPVVLTLNYIEPNRDGTGEPILYLSGLRALFASKENAYRFKFEGKHPSEFLPEAFYFDRCE